MHYTIDLTLKPNTFDLWHVCLAGMVCLLTFTLIIVFILWIISLSHVKKQTVIATIEKPKPEIQIVEKIVEVEKIIAAAAPKPVILKQSSEDAALQLLSLLQKEARFIDFIKENISTYNDAEVGIAARVVHEGCHKAMNEHFSLDSVRKEQEGSQITLLQGFDASTVRLTGNIIGHPPFTGKLIHKGWQVTEIRLPKLTAEHNAKIIATAEVEL